MEAIIFRAQHQLLEGEKEEMPIHHLSTVYINLMYVDEYQVVPSVAIGFTVYDVMKSFLKVPSRDEAVIEVVTNKRNSQPSLHSS